MTPTELDVIKSHTPPGHMLKGTWVYPDANGNIVGIMARYERTGTNGTNCSVREKQYRPFVTENGELVCKGYASHVTSSFIGVVERVEEENVDGNGKLKPVLKLLQVVAAGPLNAAIHRLAFPLQQLARGDPPRGDDVYPLSAVAATGRGYSVRAGHRHLPRDGSVLVEPVRSDVCGRDQEATPSSSVVFAMALAPGRGVRQDQWRDPLSLACGRSRGRGA